MLVVVEASVAPGIGRWHQMLFAYLWQGVDCALFLGEYHRLQRAIANSAPRDVVVSDGFLALGGVVYP